MSDDTTTNTTDEPYADLIDSVTFGLHTLEGAPDLIRTAVDNGLAGAAPTEVGDHGLAVVVPAGYNVETLDTRQFDDEPRLPSFPTQTHQFVGVRSLAAYVGRYQNPATLAYVTDVYGKGPTMLTGDTQVATVVIDDHPATNLDDDGVLAVNASVGRRAHTAKLVLRPTAAAKRWGNALGAPRLSQEQFLDLVVDGLGEIADPDGAVLRDLIQNLNALRSTEVTSVMRSGGQGEIVLAENVKLTAGVGNTVPFPEQMTIVLQPFAGVADTVTLKLRIKPSVGDSHVVFALSCGELDDAIARVVGSVADDLTDQTGLTAHWTP